VRDLQQFEFWNAADLTIIAGHLHHAVQQRNAVVDRCVRSTSFPAIDHEGIDRGLIDLGNFLSGEKFIGCRKMIKRMRAVFADLQAF